MRALPTTVALALGALLTPALLVLPSAAAPDPGDDLRAAARVNKMSVARLEALLERDATARLDEDGRLLYRDVRPTARTATPSTAPAGTFPYDQTFRLHSRPGAQRTIYLDFDGQNVSGTAWNRGAGAIRSGFYPGLSIDASPAFNDAEKDVVQDVWQRVSEDYAPFEVDVTTEDPGTGALTRSSAADQVYGMRALVTADNWCGGGCLGIAYVDVFDLVGGAEYQPAWAFSGEVDNDPIQIAESISHEVGHTLALNHDGNGTTEYFPGHGMWSPIMGAGFGALTQWSKGEYTNASETQDDIAVMAASGIPLRPDDHPGSTPTPLFGTTTGVIERRADTDVFAVAHGCTAPLTVTATPAERGPDLDIALTVTDPLGAETVVDPPSGRSSTFVPTGLDAAYSATVEPGTYLLAVDGVGARNPVTDGYSDYGSLGGYRLAVDSPCLDPLPPDSPSGAGTTVTSSSVTLRWQPPLADGGSAVTGYVVRRGSQVVVLPADARRHTFTGLAPATAYTVAVLARSTVGDSPEVTRTATTSASRPGAARIRTASSGARGGAATAVARWAAPRSTGGSAIRSYRVRATRVSASGATLSRKTFTAAKDVRRLKMRLRAGRYRFEVRAVNLVGAGPWSARSGKVVAR